MKKPFVLLALVTALCSSLSAQDITSNLVAHISFDNGDATIDAGTATVDGIVTGASAATDRNGNANSAIYFDGNDWIDFGNYTDYQFGYDSFTITFWVKGDGSTSTGGYIIGKRAFTNGVDRVYSVTYDYTNGGRVFGYIRDDAGQSVTNYPTASSLADEWHHVAMVVDRDLDGVAFYIDGAVLDAELLGSGFGSLNAIGDNYGNLVMGRSSNGDQYFKGWVDDVKIYRRALSSFDISAMQDPVNIDLTSDLKIYYPFCGGQVTDESPSSYTTGTVSSSAGPDRNGGTDGAQVFNSSLIQLPGDLISNTDFTISVWYYYTGTGQYPRLVDLSKQAGSTSDAIILYPSWLNNSVPSFVMWNSLSQQMVSLQASEVLINQWAHIVITKVGNAYTMYLNGEYEIGTSVPWSPSNVARTISHLGRSSSVGTPEWFPGSVDDFRIWQRGLNIQEVAALYAENDFCSLTVGMNEQLSEARTIGYPNPTEGIVSFKQPVTGALLDIAGRIVLSMNSQSQIDLSSLTKGVYQLRQDSGSVQRIVKN